MQGVKITIKNENVLFAQLNLFYVSLSKNQVN